VSAKLDASAALAASGALPENVNYAVKSPDMSGLSFLESVPDVDAKLKAPNTVDEKFEDVVKSAQDASVHHATGRRDKLPLRNSAGQFAALRLISFPNCRLHRSFPRLTCHCGLAAFGQNNC